MKSGMGSCAHRAVGEVNRASVRYGGFASPTESRWTRAVDRMHPVFEMVLTPFLHFARKSSGASSTLVLHVASMTCKAFAAATMGIS